MHSYIHTLTYTHIHYTRMYSHAHTIGIIILYINCRSGEDIYKLIFARCEDRQKVGKCTIILFITCNLYNTYIREYGSTGKKMAAHTFQLQMVS